MGALQGGPFALDGRESGAIELGRLDGRSINCNSKANNYQHRENQLFNQHHIVRRPRQIGKPPGYWRNSDRVQP